MLSVIMLKVFATIGCLALVILIWSLINWLRSATCWNRKKVAAIPEKISPVLSRSNIVSAVEDNVRFLPDSDDEIKNLTVGDVRSLSEREYFSQTSRDLSWLDMWQTKAHRRTEFAKSMTALILPKPLDTDVVHHEQPILTPGAVGGYDEADCERELLVVPANMTSGMCDHNLAMGLFLWSPSKIRLKGAVEEEALKSSASVDPARRRKTEGKAREIKAGFPKNMSLFPNCVCGSNHTPLSPLTAMSSATVSALSSVKSSPSGTYSSVGYPHQRVSHRSDVRGNIILTEVQEKLGRYSTAPHSPILSPSSSSASMLSPPPPSTETCSMSPQHPPNMSIRRNTFNEHCVKAAYPLRYNRENFHTTTLGQSRSPKLVSDYSNISTLSSPTVMEESITPHFEERDGVFAGEVELCVTDQFQSPYE